MKQQIIELLEEVLERLGMYHYEYDPDLSSKVKRQILRLKDVEEVRHISKLQEQAEELPYAVRNLNLPDLKDEELDRLAREEVERSLYGDGIIEDPDCDGGLLG